MPTKIYLVFESQRDGDDQEWEVFNSAHSTRQKAQAYIDNMPPSTMWGLYPQKRDLNIEEVTIDESETKNAN